MGPSDRLEVGRRRLAGPLVGGLFVADLLTFVQTAHSRLLDSADVHKHILAAGIRLNEAVAFFAIEPLHSSRSHISSLEVGIEFGLLARGRLASRFERGLERGRE